MTALIELERLGKSYDGVPAISDVTFSIARGSVHGLVGENGAGKSTLISLIAGANRPDGGAMRIDGASYAPSFPLDGLRAGISTLYQEPNLLEFRTVAENIFVGAEPSRRGIIDRRALKEAALGVLHRLGASHIDPMGPLADLSVADRQLVEIAKALSRQTRLIIMDEPTAALTSSETEDLFRVITALRNAQVAVLYVSHRMDEIFRICDHVTVLRDGRVVLDRRTTDTDPRGLVAAMIGRNPDAAYPDRTPGEAVGAPILTVAGARGRTFDNVSFDVRPGEILALAGVSGSGQEEVGMALFGATRLRSGELRMDGHPVRLTPSNAMRRGIALVPADRKHAGVIGELSVMRNLSLAALESVSRLGVLDARRERRAAKSQIENLSIKVPSLHAPVRELSGGNAQKVSLGKWLVRAPRIFILIEPTQGVDVGAKFDFHSRVRTLVEQGAAVLMVSSDLTEVLGVADRIIVMRQGSIVGGGAAGEFSEESLLALAVGATTTDELSA